MSQDATTEDEKPDAHETAIGFILDIFHETRRGQSMICVMGRLTDGRTFAFVDTYRPVHFYLNARECETIRLPLPKDATEALQPGPWLSLQGEALVRVDAPTVRQSRQWRTACEKSGLRTYEADVAHTTHYVMDKALAGMMEISGPTRSSDHVDVVFHNPNLTPAAGDVDLSVVSLDIETDETASTVYAISLVFYGCHSQPGQASAWESQESIHMVADDDQPDTDELFHHKTEAELLTAVAEHIRRLDPDVLTGWNVLDFDFKVLLERAEALKVPFNLGRTEQSAAYLGSKTWGASRVAIRGRQVLDAMRLVRGTGKRFDDFRLGTVSQAILGRGKTLQGEEWEPMPDLIETAYRQDKKAFVEYCLEDSRLVRDILNHEGLIPLTLKRSCLLGLPMEKTWSSILPFETLYTRELHKRDIAAPTHGVDVLGEFGAPGGLVMHPIPGMHDHVWIFDFKSLYPSLIRTFNLDPLAFTKAKWMKQDEAVITAPNGARFSRHDTILPQLLDAFWAARDEAKSRKDEISSFAYKIIMNSFYGVLGSAGCRFAARDIAGGITSFGQFLLNWTKDYVEEHLDARVVYGDTDSVFVQYQGEVVDEEQAMATARDYVSRINTALSTYITETYGVESKLELEFETYLRYLILPPDRAGADSRAKSYAGWHYRDGEYTLMVKGMEAVRSDWTPLARQLQMDLLTKLFTGESHEAIEGFIQHIITAMSRGECDDALIYRKSIRKPLAQYTKTTPPHVKAARLLPKPVRVVRYLLTEAGPQPRGFITAKADYAHYVDKQIKPIVENLAAVSGFDAERACQYGAYQRKLF